MNPNLPGKSHHIYIDVNSECCLLRVSVDCENRMPMIVDTVDSHPVTLNRTPHFLNCSRGPTTNTVGGASWR